MTKLEQLRELDALGVEFAGLIFYPRSPRYVGKFPLSAGDVRKEKLNINRVGVFVNADADDVLRAVDEWRLHMVQLHGDESAKYCEHIGNHVTTVKAFRVGPDENIAWKIHPYRDAVDMFLFDSIGVNYGGNGSQFDWELLASVDIGKPYFLSGGIGPQDAETVRAFAGRQPDLFALDVNSRFETAPGVKDMRLVEAFKKEVGR